MPTSKPVLRWFLFFARVRLDELAPRERGALEAQVVAFITGPRKPTGDPPPRLEDLQAELRERLRQLNAWEDVELGPVYPVYRPLKHGVARGYGYRTKQDVATIFIAKALDEVVTHWPLKWCKECGWPFVPASRGDQAYCSARCSSRYRQRKYREDQPRRKHGKKA